MLTSICLKAHWGSQEHNKAYGILIKWKPGVIFFFFAFTRKLQTHRPHKSAFLFFPQVREMQLSKKEK